MSRNYFLMNKNQRLLEFQVEETLLGENIIQVNSFSDLRPIGFTDIATWLNQRNYAKHKEHFRQWLNEWGINTTKGFIEITHCLGINDCLWVREKDSELDWETVNLYHNQFTDVAQRTAFESGLFGLQLSSTDISPEFTSEGTAPKCWKKEGENISLYKANLSGAVNRGLEANAEYISSMIARQIVNENSIPYDLVMFKGKLCSKCQLFTSEQYGYVPFYKFIDANKTHNLNDILRICSDMGYEDECRKMILVDSIVFNQDRHMGNFGFMVDNETFRIVGFAPLFDYNLSMLCGALDSDIKTVEAFHKYEDDYQVGHKLGGKFSNVGKAILTPDIKETVPQSISFPRHSRYNLNDERVEKLTDIIEENLSKILGKQQYYVKYNSDILQISESFMHEYDLDEDTALEMAEEVGNNMKETGNTIEDAVEEVKDNYIQTGRSR